MKIYQKLQSSSRHVYLEVFVRYPRQDRFLYAKSPTTVLPPVVLLGDDEVMRRKKKKRDEAEEEEERKKEEQKRQILGHDMILHAMRFDLKNVKLKIPQVPHAIFGRLMAKDDYFPTAIGTFNFTVDRGVFQDRRANVSHDRRRQKEGEGTRKDPEVKQIDVMSSWKVPNKDKKDGEEIFQKIGLLTIRIIGYVQDTHPDQTGSSKKPPSPKGRRNRTGEDEGSDG